jgi:acetylcholinesterase
VHSTTSPVTLNPFFRNMLKLLGTAAALLGAVHAQNSTSLPEVDLGYEIYKAASFNVRYSTTCFTNFNLT